MDIWEKKMKRYSVLMLLWYKEKPEFLKISIQSMADQTIPPAEFVFVRDHEISPEFASIIKECTKNIPVKYVDVFELFGQGLGCLRAKGVENCSYELIACMDSDDIAFPDRCEKQLAVFEKNPGFAIVGGIVAEFSDNLENIISYRIVPENHVDIVKFAKFRSPFTQSSVMFRKSVILNVGNYNISYKGIEDYELWFRLLKSGYIAYNIPEPLIYFRAGEQLIEHRSEKRNYCSYIKLKKQMREQKFINWFDYQISVIIQIIFYYSPFFIKKLIYTLLRRKKIKRCL
jgi:cellulose synthase/poly-beta-1,6-N-acetylglucosamine synthase-like glycosyltransferase